MVDRGLCFDCFDFSLDFVGNGGFGASPVRSSVWCSPAVFYVSPKILTFDNNILFLLFLLHDLFSKMNLLWY